MLRPALRRLRRTGSGYMQTVRQCVDAFGHWQGVPIALDMITRDAATLRFDGRRVRLAFRRSTSDRVVFQQVFIAGEYDHSCLPTHARLIVDAGANVGYASVFFSRRYPTANVLAIEPEESNFRVLSRHVRVLPNVRPMKAALWHSPGRLHIINPTDQKWSFRVAESAKGSVPAITVEDILRSQDQDIDILKIDIEGAEKELFENGADVWLPRVRTLILETHDRFKPGCSSAVDDTLSRFEHRRYRKGENEFFVLG
jgi:FkbM family methyltransferase